jgi:hypothetical protein
MEFMHLHVADRKPIIVDAPRVRAGAVEASRMPSAPPAATASQHNGVAAGKGDKIKR